MSIISVGKKIGDLDIRLGIPPSKAQFDVSETNRRFSVNNVTSNYNSVYNIFRSGITQSGGFARPTQFIVTIDGPKATTFGDTSIYADAKGKKSCCWQRECCLSAAIKKNIQLRMDLFCSNVSLPDKTITDDTNETYYILKEHLLKNVQFNEITLEFYTSINYDERVFFEGQKTA